MRRLVVLSGAGVSAESGLKTFRDSDGLWEGYDVTEVATPEAWQRNPELVQSFYNERRKQVLEAEPNKAHRLLAELEDQFRVTIVTQNIDDLHERAGSSDVVHLHGEICKSQSSVDARLVYPIKGSEIKVGDLCELGFQLRPHVVWFGEAVPMLDKAAEIVRQADLLVVVGTSLAVYPAAGLIYHFRAGLPRFIIDPRADELVRSVPGFTPICAKATEGVEEFVSGLNKYLVCSNV